MSVRPVASIGVALALCACSSSGTVVGTDDGGSEAAVDAAGNPNDAASPMDAHEGLDTGAAADRVAVPDTGAPAFSCAPTPATSPVLAGQLLLDPADPHPGDTLTVLIKSTNGYTQATAPAMTLEATTAAGTQMQTTMITSGVLDAKGVVYYYEVPDVPLGDVCLLSRIMGNPEVSGKITVTPRPAPPPSPQGVYHVTMNHQFTCQEEPTWGNEFHVAVLDANGAGIPGAIVDVHLPATTDTSNIKNSGQHPVPTTLTMDGTGHYDDYFWWPSNTNGFTVFELSVEGAASDVATEITTGWWDSNAAGCSYCSTPAVNVYGHWSHRIVFQLDPSATQACVVPSDHAGQSNCGAPGHLYHDPSFQSCWPR